MTEEAKLPEISTSSTNGTAATIAGNSSLHNGGTDCHKENSYVPSDSTDNKQAVKVTANGDVKSPLNIPNLKKEPSYLRTPTKSLSPKSPEGSAGSSIGAEKKKVPMNKVQVGATPSPNLKVVRSKIGSLENSSYKPGGGKVKIENKKLKWNAQPRIEAKNNTYTPGGGAKKIEHKKLQWNAKSKIGSLENATHKPGGGEKKIESVKLDFKEKAKPKIGSKENIKHSPGGGTVKTSAEADSKSTSSDIEDQKLEIKAQSKVGSLDNVKHRPGGGDKKIYDDKTHSKQTLKEDTTDEQPKSKDDADSNSAQDKKQEMKETPKEDPKEIKQVIIKQTTPDKTDENIKIVPNEEKKLKLDTEVKQPDEKQTSAVEEFTKVKTGADIQQHIKLKYDDIKGPIKENANSIKEKTDIVKETINAVKTSVTDKTDAIKESVKGKADIIKEILEEKADTVKENTESIKESVKGKSDTIKEAFKEKSDTVKETANVVKQESDTIKQKVDMVTESLREEADTTKECFKAKTDAIEDSVKHTTDSAKEFIKEKTDTVKETIGEKSGAVKESIEKKADAAKETLNTESEFINKKVDPGKETMNAVKEQIKGISNTNTTEPFKEIMDPFIKESVKDLADTKKAITKIEAISEKQVKEATTVDINAKDETDTVIKEAVLTTIDNNAKELLMKTKEEIDIRGEAVKPTVEKVEENLKQDIPAKCNNDINKTLQGVDVKGIDSFNGKESIKIADNAEFKISDISQNRTDFKNQNEMKEIKPADKSLKTVEEKLNISQTSSKMPGIESKETTENQTKVADIPTASEIQLKMKDIEQKTDDKQEIKLTDTERDKIKEFEQKESKVDTDLKDTKELDKKIKQSSISCEDAHVQQNTIKIDKDKTEELKNIATTKSTEQNNANGGLCITKMKLNNGNADGDVVSLPGSVFPPVSSQQSSGTPAVF